MQVRVLPGPPPGRVQTQREAKDATGEIYYAQRVDEESSLTVRAGLKEGIERKGVFCALYSDRGRYFGLTPKAGGKIDPHRLTQAILRSMGRVVTGFNCVRGAHRCSLRERIYFK